LGLKGFVVVVVVVVVVDFHNRVFAIMNNVYDDACKSWLKIEGWCSL